MKKVLEVMKVLKARGYENFIFEGGMFCEKLAGRSIGFKAIKQNNIRIVLYPYIIWIARSYPVRKESRNRK